MLKKIEAQLMARVQREYNMGFQHIRNERERKRHIMDKVLDQNLPD